MCPAEGHRLLPGWLTSLPDGPHNLASFHLEDVSRSLEASGGGGVTVEAVLRGTAPGSEGPGVHIWPNLAILLCVSRQVAWRFWLR